MSHKFHFTKIAPGVYLATRDWSMAYALVRRRVDGQWETAATNFDHEPTSAKDRIESAKWSICPVAGAASTRQGACQAHWYYFDRQAS